MDRWSLFVDIEGFSEIYPESAINALMPLMVLMQGIYYIGVEVCPESPERIFAHQRSAMGS